jgi:hypothetical protein
VWGCKFWQSHFCSAFAKHKTECVAEFPGNSSTHLQDTVIILGYMSLAAIFVAGNSIRSKFAASEKSADFERKIHSTGLFCTF